MIVVNKGINGGDFHPGSGFSVSENSSRMEIIKG
jgi:hypothetical protein